LIPIRTRLADSSVLQKAAHGIRLSADAFGEENPVTLEKYLSGVRIAGILLTALVLPFLPVGNILLAYLPLAFAFAYTCLILWIVIPRKPELLRGGVLACTFDTVALSLAVAVTGADLSPFFCIYYPLAALYALRFRQMFFPPVLATLSYVSAIALAGRGAEAEWGVVAFRMYWVLTTGVVAGLLSHRAARAERALATELRRTRALLQAAYAPAASLTLNGVLGAVVHHSRLLTESDCAVVLLYSQNDEPTMYKELLDDGEGAQAFAELAKSHARARQFLLKSAKPVTPADLAANAPSVPLVLDQFRSFCAVPISGPRGRVGFVAVGSRQVQLNPFHYEALAAFLERAALAIQNARLYEQLQAQMQELRVLHDHIVRAERLAAIGELAAKVAHELNNPLASIHLYNSLLLEEPAEPDEQRRLAENVQEQVERAKRVVRDILDYSRPTQAQLQTTSLNSAVEQGMRFVRHAANAAKVTVVEDYADNLPWVRVDISRMAQVFTNLTMNAIQAMPRGGKLEVSTGLENNELYVRFKDTGTGIGPEDMERLFDPFFSTKPSGQGTGLGLAVCRTLVNQHHGDITVKSEPGTGSTFTVWLPPAEVKEALLAR
jgi:signal transduction histidine kinase